ncbi:MAG: HPr family phosphocarrier protein [Eubacteriales bacterium]|jgi:phosphotransferase system HPr (HPr) family protein|nr:HPr family phosphocarrier protein [Eubacteriales bacterium]MDD4104446.1 HPr family phosphocarrier protein [Eubacteriales bacterium]MDD4709808.1 HPr family phosphocarrier protein [Eubacteriales bacterium]NLO14643.1 HPr family phosphocarrier protein [Clostridiales bacterium]
MIQREVDLDPVIPIPREQAAPLVLLADSFWSSVTLRAEGITVNVKSLLGLMAIRKGIRQPMLLVCDGKDEKEAAEAVSALLESYKNLTSRNISDIN